MTLSLTTSGVVPALTASSLLQPSAGRSAPPPLPPLSLLPALPPLPPLALVVTAVFALVELGLTADVAVAVAVVVAVIEPAAPPPEFAASPPVAVGPVVFAAPRVAGSVDDSEPQPLITHTASTGANTCPTHRIVRIRSFSFRPGLPVCVSGR